MRNKTIWDFACEHPMLFTFIVGSIIISTTAIISETLSDTESRKINEKEN